MKFKLDQKVLITSGPWKGEVGVIIKVEERTVDVKCEDWSNPFTVNKKYLKVER